jgi:hypothetical protein
MLGGTLGSIHNLYFIINLVKQARQAILDENFLEFKKTFLDKYSKYNKFIVITSLSKKAYKQLEEYPLTQVFQEIDLMVNILEHDLQPKFRLLTKTEVEEYFKAFDNKKREMKVSLFYFKFI